MILDVFQINEGLAAAVTILSLLDWLLIVVIIAVLVVVVSVLGRRAKKTTFRLTNLIIIIVSYILLPVLIISSGSQLVIKQRERLLKKIFFHDGFVYSFLNYSLKSIVKEPEGYNEVNVNELIQTINDKYVLPGGEKPELKNIIVIQMESFSDPYMFPGSTFEKDPIPFLHSLEKDFTTGSIDVPVFGGQTVKSEFEFLTGLNMDLLPYGYSPYVQYIDKNPIDSLARYMKANGYTPTSIHDYQGEFFSRNLVYGNLGFRRFIPYELMPNVQKRPGAIWANDSVLLDNISQVLDSTEGGDFIFTVTVQLHSKYLPIEESEFPMEFEISGDADRKARFAYYLSQIIQFDEAMKSITDYLEERNEPTFVLFYSDHLPNLYSDVTELTEDEKYTTKFYSWNNVGLEKLESKHMELFSLSTYLCDMIGFEGTLMNKFHSVFSSDLDYMDKFKVIQYYIMNSDTKNPDYKNAEYEIGGLNPFYIESIDVEGDIVSVKGQGFTDDTYLCINDKVYEPVYIDTNTLILNDFKKEININDIITVQII